ncbi:zinc metallochaperone AztD [Nakamurella deserti]|uniref:zinc metallochaperone AztD n=1 Tax=Nakamurella deserti TaxID=2164074 RepID=UPI000DBE0C86|nr:zinc metallochaperone AztD [Nakamurella deserti]
MKTPTTLRPLALLAGAGLVLTACGSPAAPAARISSSAPAAGTAATSDSAPSATTGASDGTTRVALTYDGGLLVLDGTTLELAADLPLEGFNRVNPAGDGRHVMVSTTGGFQVLDAGTAVDGAASEPTLTDLVFAADAPGHVVRHGGRTVLFADGTGDITAFDTDALDGAEMPEVTVTKSEAAHHGVAIELTDGSMLSTLGTADGRTGVRVLDASGTETARNEQCPAVHGEGTAQDEVVVFGCSDGVLVYQDGTFTKLQAPDTYGRMGNAYVSETSPLIVGDYNSDPDSEGYLLTELALIDTTTDTLKVVDLPDGVKYTWRDVARGPADEIVLLSADGTLNTLDPATGDITESWDVIQPWTSPVEWQDPHPALSVHGDIAYVTEPAEQRIVAVDLTDGTVVAEATLPGTPNEIAVAAA